MKKFLTLLTALLFTAAVNAQAYKRYQPQTILTVTVYSVDTAARQVIAKAAPRHNNPPAVYAVSFTGGPVPDSLVPGKILTLRTGAVDSICKCVIFKRIK